MSAVDKLYSSSPIADQITTIDTLESIHGKIIMKMSLISDAYKLLDMDVRQIDTIRTQYQTNVTDILIQYYDKTTDPDELGDLLSKFVNIISTENYISTMNTIIYKLRAIEKTLVDSRRSELSTILNNITSISINTDSRSSATKLASAPTVSSLGGICECGDSSHSTTAINKSDDMRFCTLCGTVGTSPIDDYISSCGQSSSKRTHRPNKHYDLWMNRLQGKDSVIANDDFERLKALLQRDGIQTYKITPPLIRQYLQEAKLTNYNNKTSKLYIMLTNKKPYNFTYQEDMLIGMYFNIAMDIFDNIKGLLLTNKRYYPYFIYKIIEEKFAGRPDALSFLSFIHLQSKDTVIEHDILYKQICSMSDGQLTYTPTNFYK